MRRDIGCTEAVGHLWEFLDQTLDVHDHQALEAHLAFCMRCCGELEFAKELIGLLRKRSAGELPVGVEGRLGQFIDGLVGNGEMEG